MRIIRVRFSKTGDAAYISHLDLQRVMHRCLAKSQLPVWYSLGFNPHIYITFPLPLPLGQESICEAMDFKTEDDALTFEAVQQQLNAALPAGLRVYEVTEPKYEAKDISFAVYRIRLPDTELTRQALAQYNQATEAVVTKIGKKDGRKTEKQVDLKPYAPILEGTSADGWMTLELLLPAGSSVNVNPAQLIGHIEQVYGLHIGEGGICRTQILLGDKTVFC